MSFLLGHGCDVHSPIQQRAIGNEFVAYRHKKRKPVVLLVSELESNTSMLSRVLFNAVHVVFNFGYTSNGQLSNFSIDFSQPCFGFGHGADRMD